MSLLWMEYETEFQNLVDIAFQYEQDSNPEYFSKLSDRTKRIICRDTRYNIDFLYTAYTLNDTKIMDTYARWLFRLMNSIFKNRTDAETADYVVSHMECIRYAVVQSISDAERKAQLEQLLDVAVKGIREEAVCPSAHDPHPTKYENEIQQYLDSLLTKNMRKTLYLMQEFLKAGIPITDIYTEIISESMRRVGELWHTAQITVDTEHYCTSATQMALAQLYPVLFANPRKNKTLLCACPGTELHEMGARMVADLFENDGWDSIYLGAAVPIDALLDAIYTNHPDLLALSVTMPQHLLKCQELITEIRKELPDLKIAVGGNAFRSTHELWKQWPVDFYTDDARDLLQKANSITG